MQTSGNPAERAGAGLFFKWLLAGVATSASSVAVVGTSEFTWLSPLYLLSGLGWAYAGLGTASAVGAPPGRARIVAAAWGLLGVAASAFALYGLASEIVIPHVLAGVFGAAGGIGVMATATAMDWRGPARWLVLTFASAIAHTMAWVMSLVTGYLLVGFLSEGRVTSTFLWCAGGLPGGALVGAVMRALVPWVARTPRRPAFAI